MTTQETPPHDRALPELATEGDLARAYIGEAFQLAQDVFEVNPHRRMASASIDPEVVHIITEDNGTIDGSKQGLGSGLVIKNHMLLEQPNLSVRVSTQENGSGVETAKLVVWKKPLSI